MRYMTVVITLLLAVMLAGCDDAPASLGSSKCFRLQNSHALEMLGSSAGFAGSVYMRSFSGVGTYDQWIVLADGNRYGSIWVYASAGATDHPSGWQVKFENNRVCIDRQLATESGTLEYIGRYER